jgi:hypothetical protein
MLQGAALKVIKIKNKPMAKKNQQLEPIEELCDLMKKTLILNLFNMNVPQADIAKKLHTDLNAVNEFLKGIKKK